MDEGLYDPLIMKIGSLMAVDAPGFAGIQKDLDHIRGRLEEMQARMIRVNRARETRIWARQVKAVALRLEDIIDEFIDHLGEHERRRGKKYIHRLKNAVYRNRVSEKLRDVRLQLDELHERKTQFYERHIRIQLGLSIEHLPKKGLPELYDDEFSIGMEENRATLISWLTKEEETYCRAIAVQGMGGLGKTTLAAQVYSHQEVKKNFDFRAWVTVSKTKSVDQIMGSILFQFIVADELRPKKRDRGEQMRKIHDYMQRERCVIVFDDVWSLDGWDVICQIFPDSMCRSKIVYTTRDYNVASKLASRNFILKLQPLKEDEAWALFCLRTFHEIGGSCPSELEDFARQLVKKCDGLPLAIHVLVRKMYNQNLIAGWRMALNDFKSFVADDWEIKHILKLSFDNLPYRLKNCFLYCSAFPVDFLISKMRLVRSWVAEGFVEVREGMTPEEVAEGYLDDLISRSLLQVAEIDHTNGIIACKMHYFIRNLAVTISREELFCVSYNSKMRYREDGTRRLSLHMFQDDAPRSMYKISHLRTLLVFANNSIHPYILEKMITSSFKSLRVLDLEGASIESLPNAVGNLINLRFLNLHGTAIKELPRSIGRLRNLQTLDLTDSEVVKLPDEIVKLMNLRHLLAFYDHYGGTQVPEHVCDWKDLQSLEGIEASDKVIQKIGNLTQLRSLTIVKVRPSDESELGASLTKLNSLVALAIYSVITGDSVMQMEVLSPPKSLQSLTLRGRLDGLPPLFGSLVNLTHLYLFQSRLREDPLLSLQSLPKLAHLTLTGAFNGKDMLFKAKSFSSLKTLFLRGLSFLKEITIAKGAMEKLEVLILHSCKQLKILPLGIEYLKTLKKFELYGMPVELMERVRAEGDYHPKIQHIPCIKLTYLNKREWIYEDIYSSSPH
ncbi:Disease resistance protein RPM1 [Acorus calamus]|uniref:Disease resistance protein RPM1 n=1 Tax=Acorus calamus TaxID=4465 RepID=A0AAV9D4P8_ACOCL|nr:Disease resistance protein RPM1 [Acorus calamus]